ENNQGSVVEGIENKEQWEGPEFQHTASSGQEREAKVFTFNRIEEEGERYFTPCYMGGLHVYDEEINLKSFMRLTKGNFGNGIITIHPELDLFLDNYEETEKFEDDWDHLLDIDFRNVLEINEAGLPPFKEEEEAIKQVKGEALKEKEDPGAFVILIRLEAKINLSTLADTGSEINVMPNQRETSVDWNVLNILGCGNAIKDMLEVRVNEMGSDEVMFTSEAWKHDFDINEPIYTELCHEFDATFEFDEVVADVELMTKKAIKFRLCCKAYAMSILDFAELIGLYTGAKIQEYGFETYFIGGLRNDDDYSADQYWLNISSEETLTLSRSSAKTIRKHVLRVLQKMIIYGLCQRTTSYDKKKGVGTQRGSLICCGQFVTKIAKRLGILSDEVYSTPTPTAMSPSSDMHSQAALAKSAALRFEPTSKEVMSLGLTVF
nr:hypothetical protein [Tanacetum cinerariifolium]